MTSHYVIVTNKLYLDAKNNDYIVRCKLGSHTISGCSVTGVGPQEPPPAVQGSKKKPGLNRVKRVKYLRVVKGISVTRDRPFLFPVKCETALFFS